MSVPLSSATSAPMARKGSGAPDAPSGAGGASTGSSSATNVRVPIMHDYEGARERSRVLRTLSHLSKTQASSSSLDGAYAYPETESDSETPQRSSSASSPPTRPAARSPAASLRGSFSAFARGAAAAVRATGAASGAGGGAVYYVTEQPGGPASAGIGGRSSRQGSASDTPAMPIPTTPGAGPTRRPRRESPGMNASAAFATASRTAASASPTHTLSPRTSPSSSFSTSRATSRAAGSGSPEQQQQQQSPPLTTPTQRNPDPASSAAASRRSSSARLDAFSAAVAASASGAVRSSSARLAADDAAEEESYFDAHDAPSPRAASPAVPVPPPSRMPPQAAMEPASSSSVLAARRPSGVVFDEPPPPVRARKVSASSGTGASSSAFRRWASASSEALGLGPSNDHLEAAAGRASMDVSRAPVSGSSRRVSRAAVLEEIAPRNSIGDGMEVMSSPARPTADAGEASTQNRSARSSFSLFTRRGSAAAGAQESSGSMLSSRRPSNGDPSGLRAPVGGAERSRRTSTASRFGRSRDNLALEADEDEDETSRGSGFKSFFKKTIGRASGSNTPASASASTFASPNPSRPSMGGFTPASSSPTLAETQEATQTFASAFGQPVSSRAAAVAHEDVGPLGERLPQAAVPQGPAPAYSATWAEMLETDRPSPLSSPSDRGSAATVATDGTSASCHLGAPNLAAVAAVAAPGVQQAEQAKSAGKAPEASNAVQAAPASAAAPIVPVAGASSSSALGIDQEQARAEASARQASSLGLTIGVSPTPSLRGTSRSSSASGNGGAAGGSQPPRRPRAVGRLSQLPRLDSMRIERENNGDAGEGHGGSSDRERRGSQDGGGAGDDSEEDTGDEETADTQETETETESDEEADGTGGSEEEREARAAAAGPATTAPRALPPVGIQLPPAPAFRAGAPQLPDVTPVAVGRDSWARFAEATPFETPRNTLSPQVTPSGRRMAPIAGEAQHEPSYFNHRPAPARTAQGHAPDANMPPPSPSVISRSRAPSSASLRSTRSPAQVFGALAGPSGSMPPPPLPHTASGLKHIKPPSRSSTISSASGAPIGRIGASGEPLSPSSPTTMLAPNLLRPGTERLGLAPLPPVTKPPATHDRPGLYQQKSRSLIDLSGPLRREFSPSSSRVQSPARTPIAQQPSAGALLSPAGKEDADVALNMRRRRSMFEVGAAPPPYSIIHRRPEGPQVIFPREEEGRERLPGYFCGVHIEGYLPRKMEFSAPGVQAKDRSWRRLYFVLHGTSLRVYKNDLSGSALPSKGVWGSMSGTHVHLEPMNAATPVQTKDGPAVAPSSSSSGGSVLANGITPKAVVAQIVHSSSEARHLGSGGAPPTPARNYTLQGAESGLAADYLKRRHVVRVRLEGEQFLLQTRNDRHVVDWIEALQASTNVALDLEKRAMPKFITLPRRRRRRRVQGQADPEEERARQAEEADLAEAQRRSMRDAGRGSSGRASESSTPAPSSAFDEMLREEHAHMQRVEASDI